ncbi:MAG: SAM-dependent methyltransferase [Pseudomonadota bacterium]
MLLKIGELAKHAGLTVRTLHHYDHIGLLSPSVRSDSGFRLYNQQDVEKLHRIQALKQFGCSLADIGAFLSEPGASVIEIICRQAEILKEQAERADELHQRLLRLKGQLVSGEETGLTDWLTILKMMTMYEKHLSKEELETLLSKKAPGRLDKEWTRLSVKVRALIERGTPPESPEAQSVAWRWITCFNEMTGNNAILAMKLRKIHREEQSSMTFGDIAPEIVAYLTRSFAEARIAMLAGHLSACELADVRKRLATHLKEWPTLIAEIRQRMDEGMAPSNPAIEDLARRWRMLFRASYSGGDDQLEKKIREAFRKEPFLHVGIGIDKQFITFIQRAVMNLNTKNEYREKHFSPDICSTALRVATLRGVHQLLDRPLVFEDPLALKILGQQREESLCDDLEKYSTPLLKGIRTSVIIRSRLAEDEWTRSEQRGVRQYVILGAGLDTFAYRNNDLKRQEIGSSRIFEVDLPKTQQWKRACLRDAGILEPARLSYVPIDFEQVSLAEGLVQAGFRASEPAFFSWLGVTMYLGEDPIFETLRFIGSLPPESGVIFDYAVTYSHLTPREQRAREVLAARAEKAGEPWKTDFVPAHMMERLKDLGFGEIVDYGPKEVNAKYLSGRDDGLRKSGVSMLVCAKIVRK